MESVLQRASSRQVRSRAGIRVARWLNPPSSSVSVAEGPPRHSRVTIVRLREKDGEALLREAMVTLFFTEKWFRFFERERGGEKQL